VFAEYERLDVDGVLFSSTGSGQNPDGTAAFATEAQAHVATNSLWVSFAMGRRPRPAEGPMDDLALVRRHSGTDHRLPAAALRGRGDRLVITGRD